MAVATHTPIPLTRALPTFAQAAESYLRNGGEARYLKPILARLGEMPVAEIVPYQVHELVKELLPTQSGATRNRAGITPIRAVLLHAYDRGWCPLIRLRRFKAERPKRKKPASQTWLHLFCRQCDADDLPHLAALILFMSRTGARVSEAVRLCWSEVDLTGRTALLLRTKTSTNSLRHLTDDVIERLRSLGTDAHPEDRVFRYRSRFSVNERIAAVCHRAGIAYKPSHTCGRHSFATTVIRSGMDIRSAMEAGDWRSSVVFIETYVHAEGAGRLVADRLNSLLFGGEV